MSVIFYFYITVFKGFVNFSAVSANKNENRGVDDFLLTEAGVVYKKLSTAHLKAVWPSGAGYDGEMKNGLMHGKGKQILQDGTIKEGTFENDKFVG